MTYFKRTTGDHSLLSLPPGSATGDVTPPMLDLIQLNSLSRCVNQMSCFFSLECVYKYYHKQDEILVNYRDKQHRSLRVILSNTDVPLGAITQHNGLLIAASYAGIKSSAGQVN